MTASNLAVCFAPSLFYFSTAFSSLQSSSNSSKQKGNIQKQETLAPAEITEKSSAAASAATTPISTPSSVFYPSTSSSSNAALLAKHSTNIQQASSKRPRRWAGITDMKELQKQKAAQQCLTDLIENWLYLFEYDGTKGHNLTSSNENLVIQVPGGNSQHSSRNNSPTTSKSFTSVPTPATSPQSSKTHWIYIMSSWKSHQAAGGHTNSKDFGECRARNKSLGSKMGNERSSSNVNLCSTEVYEGKQRSLELEEIFNADAKSSGCFTLSMPSIISI